MFQRKRILIVDDEEGIREVLAASLENRDYEILTAVDGQDGLDKARQFLPDLILLDVMMPKLDGWQVMRLLQRERRTQNIPIVVISAKSETESIFRSKEHRALDHFIKPVNLHELRDFVHRYVDH